MNNIIIHLKNVEITVKMTVVYCAICPRLMMVTGRQSFISVHLSQTDDGYWQTIVLSVQSVPDR